MAQVTLPPTILAIHGRLGTLIYRSRKQPDGTSKVFVHSAPTRKRRANHEPTTSQLRAIHEPNTRDKR